MAWVLVTDHLPPFGKSVLGCSNLVVTFFVGYVSPTDGKWHLAFGDTTIHHITRCMHLPELPQGSTVV